MFGFKPLSEDENLMKLKKAADDLHETANKLEESNKRLKITADNLHETANKFHETVDKLVSKKNDNN
jgi:regulator of replication initiation timing